MGDIKRMTLDGEPFVLVPEEDYEDMLDIIHARAVVARGEESIPAEVVKAMVAGESPVRAFRKLRGLTAAELAAKAGVSQPAISDIENGRRVGRPATMKAIADALGVGLDDVL